MRKKTVLAILVVMFAGFSAGQSLQNFDYSPENDFERSLTGGGSFNQTVNFTSEANQPLPLGVRVSVESNKTSFESGGNLGEEFDVSGVLKDSEGLRDLSFSSSLSQGNLVYTGSLPEESDSLRNLSDNSVDLRIESHQAISPDSFSFNFNVRSTPGLGVETSNATTSSGSATVEAGNNDVTVDLEDDKSEANVTVESYEETTVAPPESDSGFLGGVGVEVESNGQKVKSNGTVTIGYSQSVIEDNDLDEDSVQVYFYNETLAEWTTEGITVENRDLGDNTITASVPHFSTYSAFAEEQESSNDGDDTSSIISVTGTEQANETEEENDNQNQQEPTEEEDNQENTQEEQQQDNQTQEQQDTEKTQQRDNQQRPQDQSITGQFLGSPTNIGGIIVALLVAMIAALQYSGRIEIQAAIETVREKLNN